MNPFRHLLHAAVLLCFSCSKSVPVKPVSTSSVEFTREFAEMLKKSDPQLKVDIVADLELKVTPRNGNASTAFLSNAYDEYKRSPNDKAAVEQRFVAASIETSAGVVDEVDRSRIVPIIKDRPWIEETRQAMLSRGQAVPENVYEDFGPELVILYAEDSPKTIRYLTPKFLEVSKIELGELRALACENLKRLLPKIETYGTNGYYMLAAGGDYEASLLLFDSIWTDGKLAVKGDIVVAIPTRDTLLVTGSEDLDGLIKMRQAVGKSTTGGSYRLTKKLLVYQGGKFEEFKGAGEGKDAAPPPAH